MTHNQIMVKVQQYNSELSEGEDAMTFEEMVMILELDESGIEIDEFQRIL